LGIYFKYPSGASGLITPSTISMAPSALIKGQWTTPQYIDLNYGSNGMQFRTGTVGGGDYYFSDSGGNTFVKISFDGVTLGNSSKLVIPATDSSGTPGAVTVNKASGRAAIASGASSVVVTNSFVTASSIVHVQLETSAAGVGGLVAVPGAGSFTVTSVNGTGAATATTANCKFSFIVFN
jgi:hypothetical protein